MGSNDQMLTWNTHSKTILDGVKSVHITDKYTDVTLVAGGEFFPAHRVILGACSEYFEMLFSYADNPKPFIVLDQPSKFIRGLLDYIYEGEVQIPSEDMKQFFKVAQFLKVRGLYVTDDDDPLRLSHHVVPPIPPTPIDENAKFQENLRLSLAHVDYLGSKYRPKGIQSATIAPSSAATTTTISAIPTTVNFGVTNPFSLNVVTNQLFGGANARGQINAYHLKPIMDGKRSPPLRKTPPPTKRKRTAHPTNESELASEQKAKNAKTRSNPPSRVSPVNAFPASTPSNILNIPNIISTTTSNPITTILLTTAIPSTTTTTTSVLPTVLSDKLESQGKLMGEKSSGGQQRIAQTTSPASFLLASSSTSSGAVCGGAGFAHSTDSASREALNLMPQVKIEMDEDPDEQRQLDHAIDGVDQLEGDLHAKTELEDSDNQRDLLVDDDAAAGDEGGHEGRSCSSSSSQGTEGGSSGDANGSSATWRLPSSPTLPPLVELQASSPSLPTRDTLAAPSPQPLSLVVHCNNSSSASSPPQGAGVYSSCGSPAAVTFPNTLPSCNTTPAAVADADTTVGRDQDPAGDCGRDQETVGTNGFSITSTSCGDGGYAMGRDGHEDDEDEYEVKGRVVTATTASVPLASVATVGAGGNGDGGSMHVPPSSTVCSVSPGLIPASAVAIAGLPVACLPSALSSLASLGLGLCGATAGVGAGGGSGPAPFGKISPVYGSGATGSRGGTPDIPHTNGGSNQCGGTILNGNTTYGGGVGGKQNHGATGQAAPASSYASSNANSFILNNNDSNSINNNHLKYVATMSPHNGVGDVKPQYTSTTSCSNSLPFNLSAALAAANLQHHQAGSQLSTTAVTSVGPPSHLSPTSQHTSTSNSDRQTYLCPLCGKQFGQPYNLRRHMSTHTGDRPFQCPHCEYAASQNVHLDKHIRRIHLNNASENGGGAGSASVGVPTSSPTPLPHCTQNGHHTNGGVGGGAVTLNGASGTGISIKGNGITMNAGGGGSNGILMVDPSARSPKKLVNTHWKFESTAVTP